MPENKNQHFVPQYYLRGFGNTNEKLIRLLHLESGRVVHTASIKNQCSDAYYYGEDSPIDAVLREAETKEGEILARIVRTQKLPERDTVESHLLYKMAALFSARTPRAAESVGNMVDAALKQTFRMLYDAGELPPAPPGVDPESIELTVQNEWKTSMAVMPALSGFIHLLDLKPKILRPPAGLEFITSDHPAVLLNQALFGKHPFQIAFTAMKTQRHVGLTASGGDSVTKTHVDSEKLAIARTESSRDGKITL